MATTKRARNGQAAKQQSPAQALGQLARGFGAELSGQEQIAANLLSTDNERAALTTEMQASVTSVASSIEETSGAVQSLARAQLEVSELAKETLQGSESN